MIHQNRVVVNYLFSDDYDAPTVAQLFTELISNVPQGRFINIYASMEDHQSQSRKPLQLDNMLPFQIDDTSKQALIRTMLLPAPLVQKTALFLPLPILWEERIRRPQSCLHLDDANDTILLALDIIDDILEAGGYLLSACDAAEIRFIHRGVIGDGAPNPAQQQGQEVHV